jgi:hypothetical protein
MQMHSPVVMSEKELGAALSVLGRYGGGLDEDGGGLVVLDGAELQFSGFDEEGDLVKILGDLRVACRTLFELATVGQMVIMPDEGNAYVTTAEALGRAEELATEEEAFGPCTLVENADALAAALAGECERARAYTDRVVGR